jgi:hypothetical protein
MTKLSGRCLCGAVSYEADVAEVRTGLCHCTTCQKVSGAAFSVNVFAPKADLKITNEANLASYIDTSPESGRTVTRKFCKTCGSSMTSETAAFPGMVIIKAGSLDDTSALKPGVQVWTRSKQHWLNLDPAITALPQGRPS